MCDHPPRVEREPETQPKVCAADPEVDRGAPRFKVVDTDRLIDVLAEASVGHGWMTVALAKELVDRVAAEVS
jgi:hypothetical protein